MKRPKPEFFLVAAREWRWLTHDRAALAPAPWWFYIEGAKGSQRAPRGEARPDRVAVEQEPVVELDQQSNIDWGIDYLKVDAPCSIYKECGDSTTVQVAAMLKDHGISRRRTLELIRNTTTTENAPRRGEPTTPPRRKTRSAPRCAAPSHI